MNRLVALALTFSSSLLVACAPSGPGQVDLNRLVYADREPEQWLTGGRDLFQQYYSPLRGIHSGNVKELGYAWHYETQTTRGLQATPVVVDGVMYTSGPFGVVFALNAKTGAELWRFDPGAESIRRSFACCDIVNRGVAVFEGNVYVGSLDGRLIALDAGTGKVVWEVDTFIYPERGYTITGAPYIAKDMVVIGNGGADLDARGYVSAYDAATGAFRWRFFTVPANSTGPFEHPELEMAAETWDPESRFDVGLGGTAWDGMAYDPELNLLYVGTGNGTPYPRKLRSPAGGDNLFLASILAIDPDTGRLAWHYQTTPAENWDYTATQKLILADIEIGGTLRKVLMQAPKNGFFYVLDRATGELISAEPFVPVSWASHVDMETGRPVETEQAEYFSEPKLIFPWSTGGHNWHPMAFNPETGLVYIPALELGQIFLVTRHPFEYAPSDWNMHLDFVYPTPGPLGWEAYERSGLLPFETLAEGQPDPTARSFLRAWDPVAQEIAWEIDVSGPWTGMLQGTWNGGGALTTAGNLVVQGRTTGELYFYAADSGELLHVLDTGSSIMAAPATY